MNAASNRRLERITTLSWSCSPRIARSEQARVLGELASELRRWAREALAGRRPIRVETP